MPKFIYTARNGKTGETKGGSMVAADEKSLAQQLMSQGLLLTSFEKEKEQVTTKANLTDKFFGIPLKEKMLFARNLSVMISAGLPLTKAVSTLTAQTENKRLQKILKTIVDDIHTGQTLADALAKYPAVFSELFVNMVRVGEIGGNLEEVLNIVAAQLEKEHALVSKVKGAMMYPAVIVLAMLGVGVLMLTYILPKITGVFQDMEVSLPKSTMFIISVSDFLRNNSLVAMLIAFGGSAFLYFFLTKTVSGKRFMGFVSLHLPAIKNITIKVNSARFGRIYSSLLRSGVTVVDALNIISNTLTNHYYKKALKKGVEDIQKGVPLSKIISEYPKLFPVLVYQITEVGEDTGKTEEVLLRMAEFYEEEVDQITKNLSSIIEPVLMVLIGTAVGFFAIAMLQPMYSVLENIQ